MSRYSRQTILPEIGLRGQERLSAARVLVVGAGGLGCPALQYLAAAGIGTIGIIDHDTVDISNLQRQALYTTSDQGKAKVAIAKERLSRLNPDITILTYEEALTDKNVLGLFSGYDFILDGTDNFAAKFLINDAAVKAGKPVVYGAIQGFDGQVSVFDASEGPCYRCLHPQPPKSGIMNCAEAGVIGAIAGIVGTVQAMEVIKLVTADPSFSPLIGRLWMIDSRTMDVRTLKIPKNSECPACSKTLENIILHAASPVCFASSPEEMDCHDAAMRKDALMVDVRELHEWAAGHIEGALHMPLSVLQKNPDAFTPPPDGKTCILYCQKGGRSRRAAELLISAGFRGIFSLRGGYEAWQELQKS